MHLESLCVFYNRMDMEYIHSKAIDDNRPPITRWISPSHSQGKTRDRNQSNVAIKLNPSSFNLLLSIRNKPVTTAIR